MNVFEFCDTLYCILMPRPNDRNMSTQHIAALLGETCCARLAAPLCKFYHLQTWANNTQHVATRRNMVAKRTQHVPPNNVAICCVDMLRSFGRGFTLLNPWVRIPLRPDVFIQAFFKALISQLLKLCVKLWWSVMSSYPVSPQFKFRIFHMFICITYQTVVVFILQKSFKKCWKL